ncbi:MAG: hypothetical protein ACR2QZ_03115 [Woeseiaceae bacterium]
MPDRGLDMLRKRLLESGVAPRHVARLVSELSDHYDDLEAEASREGLSTDRASERARDRMGDTNLIARQVLSEPDLRCWFHRFPKVARILLPVAYVLLLPTAPLYAGIAHAPAIGRWFVCLMLSSLVTASLFLAMQISIAFS